LKEKNALQNEIALKILQSLQEYLGTHTTGRNESENSSSKAVSVNPATRIVVAIDN
jgi:hypothetical protein